jgi:enoyl-CoA hydratase/carnithine racemase
VSDNVGGAQAGADFCDVPILCEADHSVASVTSDLYAARNVSSFALFRELRGILIRVKDDPKARVVVLQGAGDRAFRPSADLRDLDDGSSGRSRRASIEGFPYRSFRPCGTWDSQ